MKKICQPISTTTTTSRTSTSITALSPGGISRHSCSPASVSSSKNNESSFYDADEYHHAATNTIITDPHPHHQHCSAAMGSPGGLSLLSNQRTSCFPSDAQRLQITLLMRPTRCSTTIEYRPTHVLFNKMLCMIRQTKAFDLRCTIDKKTSPPSSTSSNSSFHLLPDSLPTVTLIPLDEVDTNNPYHVIVREIAFGQIQDNSVHPPALFFDLPSSEISVCSLKDELNFNRKKKKQHHNAGDMNNYEVTRYPFTYISSTDGQQKRLTKRQVFRVYDTTDEDLQSVIVSTMRSELDKLLFLSMKKKYHQRRSLLLAAPLLHDSFLRRYQELQQHAARMDWFKNIIQAKELENRARFDNVQKSLLAAWWPVSEGRECVTDKTPVPPAKGFYVVPSNDISHAAQQRDSFLRNLDAKSNLSPNVVEQAQMNQLQESSFFPPCNMENDHVHCSQQKRGSSSNVDIGAEVFCFGHVRRTSPRLRVFEDLTKKNKVLKWVER